MSLDGGLLLYGIVDHESRAGQVVGVELAGLADRVDQVTRMKIHPAVLVRSVEIPDPDRPGWGCLLVIVPPSPQAPHMVDNVYYGRGDRANRKLTDQDVRQALNTRAQHQHDVSQQLHLLRDEDPVAQPHTHGHLYVIAQPLAAPEDALVELITGSQLQETVLLASAGITQELGPTWAPTLKSASAAQRRADGVAFVSYYDHDRISESGLVELVLREDSGVALTCGRGTDTHPSHTGLDSQRVFIAVVALGLTHSVLSLTARLAQQFTGYQGQWAVGVLLDNLKGVIPYDSRGPWGDVLGYPYSRQEYEQLTTTDTGELMDNTAAVVERLLGKLVRGFGIDSRYLPYSADSLRRSPR